MNFKIASVDSILVGFNTVISLKTSQEVKFYYEKLKSFEGIIDLVPSYTTLLITYDIYQTSFDEIKEKIEMIEYNESQDNGTFKLFEIPVYYGEEVALDLECISHFKKISKQDIIASHTSKTYNVFAIGFAPGFAYLGEVSEKIAMARLETPRKMVAKGSVGIADTQTAIYPQKSPGGWNIIGSTLFDMFDKTIEELCPMSMGDKVKFKEICKEEYLDQGGVFQ